MSGRFNRASVAAPESTMRQHAGVRLPPKDGVVREKRLRPKTGKETIEQAQAWAMTQAWWPRVWKGAVWWDARNWVWLLGPEPP